MPTSRVTGRRCVAGSRPGDGSSWLVCVATAPSVNFKRQRKSCSARLRPAVQLLALRARHCDPPARPGGGAESGGRRAGPRRAHRHCLGTVGHLADERIARRGRAGSGGPALLGRLARVVTAPARARAIPRRARGCTAARRATGRRARRPLVRGRAGIPLWSRSTRRPRPWGAAGHRRSTAPDHPYRSRRTDAQRAAGRAAGRSRTLNADVAQSLFVSLKTIETHLSHVYTKLGLSGPSARRELSSALLAGVDKSQG